MSGMKVLVSTNILPVEIKDIPSIMKGDKGDKGTDGRDGSFVQKAYKTYASMVADKDNIPTNTNVVVNNDPDKGKNAYYTYDGAEFTKSDFDPQGILTTVDVRLNQAVESASDYFQSQVADTITTAIDSSTVAYTEAINTTKGIVVADAKAATKSALDTAVTDLFENGGLPATPFSKASDMTASSLPNGSYAVVTDDPLTEKIGLWYKKDWAWLFSDYNDITQARDLDVSKFTRDYAYRGLKTSVDIDDLVDEGRYLVSGTPTNSASWITDTQFIDVKVYGGFIVQTATSANTIAFIGQRKGTITEGFGAWQKIGDIPTIANLTVASMTRDFLYRGLKTAVNIGTLTDEGHYLVNGSYTDGAPWITGTQYVDVKVYGGFIVQHATSTAGIETIAQRTGTINGGFGAWSKIGGASSSSGGSSLSGKTIAFIGDSIVEGGDYPSRIGDRYGATTHKFGFGGCRASAYGTSLEAYDPMCLYQIAHCINTGDYSKLIAGAEYTRDNRGDNNVPQATALAALDWSTVDILVIAFGTNDWTSPNGLGADLTPDPTGATFKGAMAYSIEQIQATYPQIQIVLVGMSYRNRFSGSTTDYDVNSDNTLNEFSESLSTYQQAILDIADKYHIPAYDMYRNSGVNGQTIQHILADGVHPKPVTGYQHWANKIGSFLNSVI